MSEKILVINPGSTSTKMAIYEGDACIAEESRSCDRAAIEGLASIYEQVDLRKEEVLAFLKGQNMSPSDLSCIAARGGLMPPLRSGAYLVTQRMVDWLKNESSSEHPSNLAAVIAFSIAEQVGIPAYIYDAVSVDERPDVAAITGFTRIKRRALAHVLNMRAVARKVAGKLSLDFHKATFIVAHLGGGISIGLLKDGRLIDGLSDDEGPMAPERAGRIQTMTMIDLCFSGKYSRKELERLMRGKGGLSALLGTSNTVEVEDRVAKGDDMAALCYQALAYQVAKGIGEMAAVCSGKADRIILTGGLARSELVTNWISEYVSFIAPVEVFSGENEMEALALGALRVLRGEEPANLFKSGG